MEMEPHALFTWPRRRKTVRSRSGLGNVKGSQFNQITNSKAAIPEIIIRRATVSNRSNSFSIWFSQAKLRAANPTVRTVFLLTATETRRSERARREEKSGRISENTVIFIYTLEIRARNIPGQCIREYDGSCIEILLAPGKIGDAVARTQWIKNCSVWKKPSSRKWKHQRIADSDFEFSDEERTHIYNQVDGEFRNWRHFKDYWQLPADHKNDPSCCVFDTLKTASCVKFATSTWWVSRVQIRDYLPVSLTSEMSAHALSVRGEISFWSRGKIIDIVFPLEYLL